MNQDIASKLKESGLTGRGGGCFPTGEKWEMVKRAKGNKKYVVCNASEGEPGVNKDWHILNNHAGRVIDGIKLAAAYLDAEESFIYLNPDYYLKLKDKLEKIISDLPIKIFHKPHQAGYIGGEETSALNTLEHKRIEPRLRPPFPPTAGLFGEPTLINNVETFYAASLIARGEYFNKRFFTIGGDAPRSGVFERQESWTIETVLKHTKNWPDFPFFAQIGGNASGQVLNSGQLRQPVSGSGSITIYHTLRHAPLQLFRYWSDFFLNESCGQCTPCREGTLRLHEILQAKNQDWTTFALLLNNLRDSSFCGLGCAVPIPFLSYIKNVLSQEDFKIIGLKPEDHQMICECFK